MPMWSETSTEMLFLLENVLRGVAHPDEAVRETQARVDRVVQDYERLAARRRGSEVD
jgi:hypothetical protein